MKSKKKMVFSLSFMWSYTVSILNCKDDDTDHKHNDEHKSEKDNEP